MVYGVITLTGARNGRKIDVVVDKVLYYEPMVSEDPKQVSTMTVVNMIFGVQVVVVESVESIRQLIKDATSWRRDPGQLVSMPPRGDA